MLIFLVLVLGYVTAKFLWDLNKDNYDLQGKNLADKFSLVVSILNEAVYNGEGEVTPLSRRSFNLYREGSNQIINFHYSTGSLTITWKYKFLQKEVVHSKTFDEVRNVSLIEQKRMANLTIIEMIPIIKNHHHSVLFGNQ